MATFPNPWSVKLDAAIDSDDTTAKVSPGGGGVPAVPFLAVIEADGTNDAEVVKVTAFASDTITIVRAKQGTTGVAHLQEAVIRSSPNSATSGDVFPASASDGERFFRTDLSRNFIRDDTNSRWVSDPIALPLPVAVTSVTATATLAEAILDAAQAVLLEGVSLSTMVATTNNGTNCWVVAVNTVAPGGNTATEFDNVSTGTGPDTADDRTNHATDADAAVFDAGTVIQFTAKTKTGSPGALTARATAHVRIAIAD